MVLYVNTKNEDTLSVRDWFENQPLQDELRILTGYFSFGSLCYLWSILPPNTKVRIVTQAEIKTANLTTAQLIASEAATFETALEDTHHIDHSDASNRVESHLTTDDDGEATPLELLKDVYDALGDALQIRIHPDVHAKLYLTETDGLFGSSNLTRGGIERNIEFNSTLPTADYPIAETLFEHCWDDAVPFSERLEHLLEVSSVGRHLVNLPVTDRKRLQRAYGIVNEAVLDAVEGRSLGGQLAHLVDQPPRPRLDGDGAHSRYYTDLMTEAARQRGGTTEPAGFIEFRKHYSGETPELWEVYEYSDDVESLPLDPTGDLWLLDWYLETGEEPPESSESVNRPTLRVEPWENQHQAFEAWLENDREGIVEMATATGKTVVGLAAIADLCGVLPGYGDPRITDASVLVVAHRQALRNQWETEILSKLGIHDEGPPVVEEPTVAPETVDADGGATTQYPERTIWFETGTIEIQTPHYLMANPEEFRTREYDLVIYDEVHHYARQTGWGSSLNEVERNATLGLSATIEGPSRRLLQKNLGEIVFTYGLEQAQADGILPPFEWVIHPISLTTAEKSEMDELKRKLGIRLSQVNDDTATESILSELQRTEEVGNLLEDAQTVFRDVQEFIEVYKAAVRVLSQEELPGSWAGLLKPIRAQREIVYLSDAALAETVQLARAYLEAGLKVIVFSMRIETAGAIAGEVSDAVAIHGELREEQKVGRLDRFRSQQQGALVAAQLLDEGIDMPDADIGINVAATKSRLQLVQRMGRLLRREGQTKSVFHHFVPEHELEYYRGLGPVEPSIERVPCVRIEQRLPHLVGPVQMQAIRSELTSQDAVELLQADDLVAALRERRAGTWWLHSLADEHPDTFREYLRSIV